MRKIRTLRMDRRALRLQYMSRRAFTLVVLALTSFVAILHFTHSAGRSPADDKAGNQLLLHRRVAMCMVAPDNGGDLYDASVSTHARYADLHGYHFFVDRQNLVKVHDPWIDGNAPHFYQKLVTIFKYILKGLEENNYDWLMYLDSDTFLTNPLIHLESLIPQRSEANQNDLPNIMATWDPFNGFNAGVLFLRVDYWTLMFFARALAYRYYGGGRISWHPDQESMGNLLDEHEDVQERFYRVPIQRWMNSYTFGTPETIWQEGDLLLHMVSESKADFADAWSKSNTSWEAMLRSGVDTSAESDADRRIKAQVRDWWDSKPYAQ